MDNPDDPSGLGCILTRQDRGGKPSYFNSMSSSDQKAYLDLQKKLNEQSLKVKRNRRVDNFLDGIEAIKEFCFRSESDRSVRFLVCGVCFGNQLIAINITQLKLLLGKCKSSINGILQKLGYNICRTHDPVYKQFLDLIPPLKESTTEQRRWTVRTSSQTDNADPFQLFTSIPVMLCEEYVSEAYRAT